VSRRGDDAVITLSAGELRKLIREAVEEALARSRTRPAKAPKTTPDSGWSPAQALADVGARVRR